MRSLTVLNHAITECAACPRLVTYRETVARTKRRQYLEWTYWGRPIPGFGDPQATLYVLGLAPAAHGGNRTGRVFTGDRSGDWLYEALHHFGFANQASSIHRDDGLALTNCYVGATVRCAPPGNKPSPDEFEQCSRFLRAELRLLTQTRVVITLGKIAFDHYLKGENGSKRVLQDRLGHVIGDVALLSPARPGRDLRTSIDLRLQYLAYRELKRAVTESRARSGSVVVLDPNTGEVLAMVNQPSYNPNDRSQYRAEQYRNRAVTDIFEPGSSFKPLVMASALDSGSFNPRTIIDTSPGFLRINNRLLTEDEKNLGRVDLTTVLALLAA